MQGYELAKEIRIEHSFHPERMFIKWWRKEQDYIDFDLVVRFLDKFGSGSAEVAGFELIDQEEMWRLVEKRCEGRVTRVLQDDSWVLKWTPPKGAEVDTLPVYPYTPESLHKILDVESNYNYVD